MKGHRHLTGNPAKGGSWQRMAVVSSAGLSLALFAIVAFMWVRSFFATDRIFAPTIWRLNRVVLGNGGFLLQTFRAVRRTETWRFPPPTTSAGTILRPPPVQVGAQSDAPMRFEETDYGRPLRSAHSTSNAGGWSNWEWRAFNPDKFTYAQLAWTRLAPTRYPRISPQYMVDASRTTGDAKPLQSIEEQVFVGHYLWLPYWLLLVATLAWPALVILVAFKRFRVERWGESDRCRRCGYDLRASQGICPECGMAIPVKQGALALDGSHV